MAVGWRGARPGAWPPARPPVRPRGPQWISYPRVQVRCPRQRRGEGRPLAHVDGAIKQAGTASPKGHNNAPTPPPRRVATPSPVRPGRAEPERAERLPGRKGSKRGALLTGDGWRAASAAPPSGHLRRRSGGARSPTLPARSPAPPATRNRTVGRPAAKIHCSLPSSSASALARSPPGTSRPSSPPTGSLQLPDNSSTMGLSDFVNKKFKLSSSEKFDDYMKALGESRGAVLFNAAPLCARGPVCAPALALFAFVDVLVPHVPRCALSLFDASLSLLGVSCHVRGGRAVPADPARLVYRSRAAGVPARCWVRSPPLPAATSAASWTCWMSTLQC